MSEHILAEQYRNGLESFGHLMPDVLDAYNQFTSRCFQSGEISSKNKHLMAIAVSLFSGNEHCMVYHLEQALEEGATEKEIAETVAVAGAYGGGSTFSHGAILIEDVIESRKQSMQ
ncbi:carboxymuconolactone decarboxylase family protein [Brevibacillus brevis]|uniref:Carboxymuconolactone decarboxylase family protein n=1 Tax=Brevibacillus brevis TaxID=1393 RepID=A0ABY9SW96_BREBE|nr:carboxymuconolactone decarboxylase family protein [Brevibacillus brevis]WNC12106.1 carboxymuconolactone decarboxylase family protein [Brevibacillus brevis]